MTADELGTFLKGGTWRSRFDGNALARGRKLLQSRRVHGAKAEALATGDFELSAQITGLDDQPVETTLALWEASGALQLEADCSCSAGTQCEHAVALLEYLAKGKAGQRLAHALGEQPWAESITQGQHLALERSASAHVPPKTREPGADAAPSFHLRVATSAAFAEKKPFPGLPEVIALATVRYGTPPIEAALEPSGILPPIVTPTGKISRDRTREMEALQALYALDLIPQELDELRLRNRPPELPARLWKPESKAWPHPEFYWQRFQHEATPALERRGWEVRFAPDVGPRPLVFRSESWRAEMVEEGRGWFALSAGFEIDGEAFDLQPILATLVANRFLEATEGKPEGQEFMVFLPDGRGLALPIGRFRKLLKTLGEITRFTFTTGPVRLHAVDAAALAAAPELAPEVPEKLATVLPTLTEPQGTEPQGTAPPEMPRGLQATLRSYQHNGFVWMQSLARHGLHGILADDMGLGKTLQTLTHLLAEKEQGRVQGHPSLVIAPTSVVENWRVEAERFAPNLKVVVLQGPQRRRRFAKIPHADLVVTSFALLPRDLETLRSHDFHLLILDEAQHIKNPQAKVSLAAGQLNARHRLCLSGTPVENNLGELWSLFHFLSPGWLGPQDAFNEQYRHPIERQRNEAKRSALAQRIAPLILRRTKQEVAKELPPKTELVHRIELNEAQKDLYETVRATMDKHVRRALELQGQQSQIVFLDALLKLRQICCHPQLLDSQAAQTVSDSSKFDHLVDLLETLRQEGHRTLLFSQFTSMLSLIEAYLHSIECPYLKLTGETKDRQALVEQFQSGQGDVFLISLKAGGTGLTLTGADAVIHYDPWWNPAAEAQATDRAYRIGQDRPVFVHKLICKDTVEERIQQMQERKHHLASGVMTGSTEALTLTPENLEQLLAPLETHPAT